MTHSISDIWFEFSSKAKDCKTQHTAIFMLILNKSRIDQEISLPTADSMQCLSIGDKRTFLTALKDLRDWGFINLIRESKNQHVDTSVRMCCCDLLTADGHLSLYRASKANSGPSLHSELKAMIEGLNEGYYWTAKDGRAVKSLIVKMTFRWKAKHNDQDPQDIDLINSFKWVLDNLPPFYRDRWDTSLIDSKFESILKEIISARNGKSDPNKTTPGVSPQLQRVWQRIAERHSGKQP